MYVFPHTTPKPYLVKTIHPCPLLDLFILHFPAQPLLGLSIEEERHAAALIPFVAFLDKRHVALIVPDLLALYLHLGVFLHQLGREFAHPLAVRTFFSVEFI